MAAHTRDRCRFYLSCAWRHSTTCKRALYTTSLQNKSGTRFVSLEEQNYSQYVRGNKHKHTAVPLVHYYCYYYGVPSESHGSVSTLLYY